MKFFYNLLLASVSAVITCNEGFRGGKTIPIKNVVDEAIADCDCVQRVFVMHRTDHVTHMGPKDVHLEKVCTSIGK